MASRKKPQSLNDSHYRLLQDLTTPRPPKPSSSLAAASNSSSFHAPPFSLDDEEEEQPTTVKFGESRGLCDDADDTVPRFSIIDSPLDGNDPEKENMELQDQVDHEKREHRGAPAEPEVSRITKKDMPVKVKLEGRRRLCKVSSRDSEVTERTEASSDQKFSEFTDFDSPIMPKNHGGGNKIEESNDIRDILNDLSSRLDLLSIEKKRVPKDSHGDDSKFARNAREDAVPEYASAGSSFSATSEVSGRSPVENKNSPDSIHNVIDDCHGDRATQFGPYGSNLERRVHGINEGADPFKKDACGKISKTSKTLGQSYVSSMEDDRGLHGKVENESQTYRNKTNSHGLWRDEAKRVEGKPRYAVSNSKEEQDEDADCILLSGQTSLQDLGKSRRNGKELSDSNTVDVLDNSVDIAEDKTFVLAGPKFSYRLPSKIATMLYPHQLEGLKWLWFLHCKGRGGILGDDMGLGKTMQICGFLAGLFNSHLIKRALIVAPKTLLSHWIKELSVVGLSEKTREYYGTCPKARQYELQYVLQDKGILLTTYDIVRNNSKSLRGDSRFKDDEDEDSVTWDYMILDEGHLIKNPSTQRAQSLLEIPSAHRIVISGTPIQNNLRELWALFNFCCPELLGDRKEFKAKYEDLILRGNDKRASDREKRIGSTVAKELRDRIQPYFLRRLKSEVFREDDDDAVAKLSKKNELIVWLRLTSCQRRIYEAYLKSELVLSAFDQSPLAALTILKKICDHPLLLTKRAAEDVLEGMESIDNPEDVVMAEKLAMYIADVGEEDVFQETHDSISCKLSFVMSLLEKLIPEGHNVLIFSQTRKMLNLLQDSLVSHGYNYLRIDGTTKASDRMKIVDDFQEGFGAPIFLLTSQVGGLGLTLTKADRVIVVDPAWNPSTDNQSVDRAYRIGQEKDVIVYRLMTCGTVEEKIYRKQIFKGGLFKTATEHKEQIRYFSQQDLKDLFNLPKEGFDVSPTQQQLHEEHDQHHEMDDSLKSHIEFLETLGIAGVSHHSLLYSKTTPVQVTAEDLELVKSRYVPSSTYVPSSSSSTSTERAVDGAAFAFKPKDIKLNEKNRSPSSGGKLTESDIKEKINRLSLMLGNKVMVSRLPDKGQKIQKQIVELNLELEKLRSADKEVIDIDDIVDDFSKSLNV